MSVLKRHRRNAFLELVLSVMAPDEALTNYGVSQRIRALGPGATRCKDIPRYVHLTLARFSQYFDKVGEDQKHRRYIRNADGEAYLSPRTEKQMVLDALPLIPLYVAIRTVVRRAKLSRCQVQSLLKSMKDSGQVESRWGAKTNEKEWTRLKVPLYTRQKPSTQVNLKGLTQQQEQVITAMLSWTYPVGTFAITTQIHGEPQAKSKIRSVGSSCASLRSRGVLCMTGFGRWSKWQLTSEARSLLKP
jgi:hypothetical protein